MIRLPPRSSRSYPPFPYPTLLRSIPLSCSREESAALAELLPGRRHAEVGRVRQQGAAERHDLDALLQQVGLRRRPRGSMGLLEALGIELALQLPGDPPAVAGPDRTSGVMGKSVSVRVDVGGRRTH